MSLKGADTKRVPVKNGTSRGTFLKLSDFPFLAGRKDTNDAIRRIRQIDDANAVFRKETQRLGIRDKFAIEKNAVAKRVDRVVVAHADYIKGETLAVELKFEALPGVEPTTLKIDGEEVSVFVRVKDA